MKAILDRLRPHIRPAFQLLGWILLVGGALAGFILGLTGDEPLGFRLINGIYIAVWFAAPGIFVLAITDGPSNS
jgi:hypothetical protein